MELTLPLTSYAVTTTWNECQVPTGHVGLQAEYYYIEFKNLKFKGLK